MERVEILNFLKEEILGGKREIYLFLPKKEKLLEVEGILDVLYKIKYLRALIKLLSELYIKEALPIGSAYNNNQGQLKIALDKSEIKIGFLPWGKSSSLNESLYGLEALNYLSKELLFLRKFYQKNYKELKVPCSDGTCCCCKSLKNIISKKPKFRT